MQPDATGHAVALANADVSVQFNAADVIAAQVAYEAWELELPSTLERLLLPGEEQRAPSLHLFLREQEAPRMNVTNVRWNLLGPVGPQCRQPEQYGNPYLGLNPEPKAIWRQQAVHMQRLGAQPARGIGSPIRDMESKRACGLQYLAAPCTVLSIGSNGQWAFEEDIVRKTRCHVDVFDCTVHPLVEVPAKIASRVTLHRTCLGSPPRTQRDFFLHVPRDRAGNTNWRARQWRRGHGKHAFTDYAGVLSRSRLSAGQRPALLKMDIEGYEWDVLANITHHPNAPMQIAVELHFQTMMPPLPWFGVFKSPAEILALGNMLRRSGYMLVARDDSTACRWCTETLWVKVADQGTNTERRVTQGAALSLQSAPNTGRDSSSATSTSEVGDARPNGFFTALLHRLPGR